MDDNTFVVLFGDECQQTLCIDRLCSRFAQVQVVQAFFKQGGDDLVFLGEECRGSYDYKFHSGSNFPQK